jgi:hypothetical protein
VREGARLRGAEGRAGCVRGDRPDARAPRRGSDRSVGRQGRHRSAGCGAPPRRGREDRARSAAMRPVHEVELRRRDGPLDRGVMSRVWAGLLVAVGMALVAARFRCRPVHPRVVRVWRGGIGPGRRRWWCWWWSAGSIRVVLLLTRPRVPSLWTRVLGARPDQEAAGGPPSTPRAGGPVPPSHDAIWRALTAFGEPVVVRDVVAAVGSPTTWSGCGSASWSSSTRAVCLATVGGSDSKRSGPRGPHKGYSRSGSARTGRAPSDPRRPCTTGVSSPGRTATQHGLTGEQAVPGAGRGDEGAGSPAPTAAAPA